MKIFLPIFLCLIISITISAQGINTNGNSSNNTSNYINKYGKISNTPFLTKNGKVDTLVIGNSFQGGIVAYILQPGDPGYISGVTHGLIAAPTDQSIAETWGCFGIAINGADGTAIGTGNQNTIDIMNDCSTPGIAARLCGDLVLNGYNDWYLPSIDEIYKLYLNRLLIGGFTNTWYWSSSELSQYDIRIQYFGSGSQSVTAKNGIVYVRAIRSF